jgi:hypothetical protein
MFAVETTYPCDEVGTVKCALYSGITIGNDPTASRSFAGRCH